MGAISGRRTPRDAVVPASALLNTSGLLHQGFTVMIILRRNPRPANPHCLRFGDAAALHYYMLTLASCWVFYFAVAAGYSPARYHAIAVAHPVKELAVAWIAHTAMQVWQIKSRCIGDASRLKICRLTVIRWRG